MNFGIYLKAARERAGLSQKELADRLNVPQQSIGRYEKSDIDPRISFVISVASVLGIGLDELMNYKPNKQQYYFDLLDKCGYTISNDPKLDYYAITCKINKIINFKVEKEYFCTFMDKIIISIHDDSQEYFETAFHNEIQFKYFIIPSFLDELNKKLDESIEQLADNYTETNQKAEIDSLIECLKNCRVGISDFILSNAENRLNPIYDKYYKEGE